MWREVLITKLYDNYGKLIEERSDKIISGSRYKPLLHQNDPKWKAVHALHAMPMESWFVANKWKVEIVGADVRDIGCNVKVTLDLLENDIHENRKGYDWVKSEHPLGHTTNCIEHNQPVIYHKCVASLVVNDEELD